ncbi:hypothetical protein FHG89_11600 [Micromonospora orduensis]|uniref:ApeA N-terminal domain-containing protein n=1 Tax=Micromonospora orduensis TaxID=1420891 RepID=A0A5C4QRG1_9ACTN|nr:hypothetical protein [Micromonospora orduensis]TNH29645.1 hypothetical protein FHG89_11600 [Micromonospora orduensis]
MSQETAAAKPAQVRRILVLGDPALQYSLVPRKRLPIVTIDLPADPDGGDRAVEYLRPIDTASVSIRLLPQDSAPVEVPVEVARPTWSGCALSESMRTHLRSVWPGAAATESIEFLSPVMVLRLHESQERTRVEVLACTRLREVGAVFARVAECEFPSTATADDVVPVALKSAGNLREHVAVENHVFRNLVPGVEIENKITLRGDVSIWRLTSEMASQVGSASFPGFIPDVGNEVQRWEVFQHTFEVLNPAAERGYIAFQEQPSGAFMLKHKIFAEDTLRRVETFRHNLAVPGRDFAAFLDLEYPHLTFRALRTFSRTRFDVNLESSATGHFFGIEIDEVRTAGDEHVLRQAEIAYHRSRIHDGLDVATVEPELERLTNLVDSYLARNGVDRERTFYSKLSFLRDIESPSGATSPTRC